MFDKLKFADLSWLIVPLCLLGCVSAERGVSQPTTSSSVSRSSSSRSFATTSPVTTPAGRAGARLGTILAETPEFVAKRAGRFVSIALRTPHRVLSTSTVHGGQSTSITHLLNLQSMEGRGNKAQVDERLSLGSVAYHKLVVEQAGLVPETTAMMGTAANMNHTAHVEKVFQGVGVDLRVHAFVTGGVRGNALRAGDPTSWVQTDAGTQHVPEKGTINIMLLINRPLLPGAMAKAASVLVEAKSAALTELAIASRYSSHMATGTGTDQFIVAAPLSSSVQPLESASQHLKLGELIALAVKAAVLKALKYQNGFDPSRTADLFHALGRFGLDEARLRKGAAATLGPKEAEVMLSNIKSITTDPRLIPVAYAYAAVLDRMQYGTVNPGVAIEALRDQATNAAVAMSSLPSMWPVFWQQIKVQELEPSAAFIQAMCLGFAAKWPPTTVSPADVANNAHQ